MAEASQWVVPVPKYLVIEEYIYKLLLVDLFQKVHCIGLVTPTSLWYFKTFEFSHSKFTASKQAVSRSNESYAMYLLESIY